MDPSNLPGALGAGMELQHMLADLQSKCETYKSNYDLLKIEHSSLQDELSHIQGELKHLQGQQEKLQSQLAERSREFMEKKREAEELRLQVMTPKRLDLLRAQVQQDLEAPVRERYNKLEEEAEKYRSEFNKLRYAYTVLNSEFEHQKEEHFSVVEEQKMRYEVEIAHLKKDKENLLTQYRALDPLHERKQVEVLLKEKAQLSMWLKGLQAELEELQAKKDSSDQQVENIQLCQNRQLTESQAAVKSLESERQRAFLRLEQAEGELQLSQEQNSQLNIQLHKTKREVSSLTCQIESLKLSHKTEVDNVKLELTRSRGEVESECDTLRGQNESLKAEVSVLKEMLERHNDVLVEKEMAMVRKVKSVYDEEMYKMSVLLEEKLDLEQRVAEFEREKAVREMNAQAQKEEWQEKARVALQGEESARKELQGLKTKLKQQSAQLEEVHRQKAEVMDLREKNHELSIHLATLSRSEAELIETSERLRDKLDGFREEKIRCGAERMVEVSKERTAKLEGKCWHLKDKLHRAASEEKKRRDLEEKKEQSLHSTIGLLREQIDELKQDAVAANKRLMDYQQRHNEFRRLLMCNKGSFNVGTARVTSGRRAALFLGSELMLSNPQEEEDEEEEDQRELALLRRRLGDLEKVQQRQMEEMGCIEQKEQDKVSLSCDMTTSALRQSFPPGGSPGKAAAVPAGAEMELHNMLVDERTKCELHRANYETLKAEHTCLQDDFIQLQEEVRHLQAQLDRLQLQLAERTRENLEKNTQMEELRLQVMTPQRLELLRAQVQQEMEAPVRERFARLEEEAEKYRSECNKLRYAYTVLNAQLEHQKEEHTRVAEEQKLRYEAEIAHLDKDKENLSAQYQNRDLQSDRKQIELLLREKTQLSSRLKGLQAEAAELQALKENSEQRAENLQRVQNRQLAESQAALKSSEAECQSLRLRLERTESELGLSHERNNGLTGQLHKAEKQVNVLTGQIESLKHSHKMEVASVKLECSRSKGELERERDTLTVQLEGLQTDVEVLKGTLERHKDLVVEKEREVARKVQAARDEEIYKSAVAQEEKLELEHRLAELEQQVALQETQAQGQREEWEELVSTAQRGESSARDEVQSLRLRLKQQSAQLEELERQTAEVATVKEKKQELQAQLSTLSRAEAELQETNQRLRGKVEDAREELRAARSQAERSQREAERRVEESQVEWLEEKHKLQEREAKMEEKYSQLKEKMKRAAVAQKKRRKQTESKEKSLQNKIQLLKAQMEELKLEAATAKKRPLHSEEHVQLRRKWRELHRRHGEFRRLLLGDQGAFGLGPAVLPSPRSTFLVRDAACSVPEEEQEHSEMVRLCERMDELERAQQQQLEELNLG